MRFKPLHLLVGAASVGGLFWWGRKKVIAARLNRSLDSTDQSGTAGSHAQSLIQAFYESGPWGSAMGTDEKLVLETLYSIPSLEVWEKVKRDYYDQRERRSTLAEDLQDELRPEEHAVAQAITSTYLPTRQRAQRFSRARERYLSAWAQMIHWSLKLYEPWIFGGIYWPLVERVLKDLPRVADLPGLNGRYRELFGETLYRHLLDELSDEEIQLMKSILMNKADAKGKTFTEVVRGA